ncbi:MAG: hypothetical protein Fur0037_11710 [Planctomycetota bacterium]
MKALALWLCCTAAAQVAPFELEKGPEPPATRIDEIVESRWKKLGVEPPRFCSDAVFLRRAFLDLCGSIPTAAEARRFLEDESPGKRSALVDELMARGEFVDYRTMKWCDLLRVKAEFPINLWPNAVQAYHRWIRDAEEHELPYDQFARKLLVSSGSNFRDPQVNFYRAAADRTPQGLAKAAALTFLGSRYEKWPEDLREGFARCFAKVGYKRTLEWKEEIVFFDTSPPAAETELLMPDGSKRTVGPAEDPRAAFADWLLGDGKRIYARSIANRIWYWLMGRGIVHEPDDFRPDNPPACPELLDYLADELIASGWSRRHLFGLILHSRTYQRSFLPRNGDESGARDFARYRVRRLEAEVLIDAINKITGTTESYSSPIPEPFTFIPEDQPAVSLADGSITSPFLEMFGRPPRDTGLESERNDGPTAEQELHLLNSSHIRNKLLRSARLRSLIRGRRGFALAELYLTILSRLPTDEEVDRVREYARSGGSMDQVATDVAWALLNGPEFLYRH